jgi:hypothetical protein
MSYLKTLTFTAADLKRTPTERRRVIMIERLQDQLARVQSPDHARTKRVWIQEDGQRRKVEKRVPVSPWWCVGPDGRVVLSLRHGVKRVEFDKGKTGILVGSMEDLPSVIQGLIDAVARGELDHLMAPQGKTKPPMKRAG